MKKTHGESKTRLYRIWKDMRRRCRNANRTDYCLYGGRGITVCEEWQNYETFRDWAKENGYSDSLSIDRIDFNGNYEPSNCRWVTLNAQSSNTRQNVFVEINGEVKTLSEWANYAGLPASTVFTRYRDGVRGVDLIGEKKITMTGKHHTEETKRRIRESLKGEKSPSYGKHPSKETRLKMSLAKRGCTPHNKRQFAEKERQQIKEMALSGYSIYGISKKLGIDRRAIKQILEDKR